MNKVLARKSNGRVSYYLKQASCFWVVTRGEWIANVERFSDEVFLTEREAREAYAQA